MISLNLFDGAGYGRFWQWQEWRQKHHGRYVGVGHSQDAAGRAIDPWAVIWMDVDL